MAKEAFDALIDFNTKADSQVTKGGWKMQILKEVRGLMLSSWSILIVCTWNVPRSVADNLNVIISRVMWLHLLYRPTPFFQTCPGQSPQFFDARTNSAEIKLKLLARFYTTTLRANT